MCCTVCSKMHYLGLSVLVPRRWIRRRRLRRACRVISVSAIRFALSLLDVLLSALRSRRLLYYPIEALVPVTHAGASHR